ncbi:transglycosylase domain-containing protein [Mycetocola tolaasinivorans]|nr:transglycosylase domain-containing protein [Mycetocola tolaasinivorans]
MPQEKRTGSGVMGSLMGFIGLSVAAGILVTAAVTPALAVTGMSAKGAINAFDGLPAFLDIDPPMERTNIYATASDGSHQLLATFFDQNRQQVAWDDVSQYFKDAAVSTEDPRFYDHGGVDLIGTTRAVLSNFVKGGEDTQGGSSITQQYVKNVLVQKAEQITNEDERKAAYLDATRTTPERKLREMRYSIGVEQKYTKDQVLLGYLNIANFGGVSYGVESASQYYFGKSAKDVTIEEAATLIAILNDPNGLRIDRPESTNNGEANGYKLTKIRRDYVIDKMYKEGKITKEQFETATATPVTPNLHPPSTGCQAAGNAAYFCNYVQNIILNSPEFGETVDDRRATLRRGGMDVYTSIDLDVQNAAQAAMDRWVPQERPGVNLGAAASTVEPGTGRVLAMVQNKTFSEDAQVGLASRSHTSINYNTDYNYGGSSGFQVGSQYKVFALLEWLKDGRSVNDSVLATRQTYTKWIDTCSPGGVATTKPWNPQNYDGNASGRITPYEATKRSVNTAFVQMASKLDLCEIRNTAQSLGVHRADGKELERNPASVLGSNEIAPLTMAAAIAGIAAQGKFCTPVAIDKITGPGGKDMAVPQSTCTQALTPEVANTAAYAMQAVFSPGGTAANAVVPGAPQFGKTGTADDATDTWVTGGTTKAVTSFWIGNVQAGDNGKRYSMYNVQANGTSAFQSKFRVFAGITSATIAKLGGDSFPKPSDALTKTKQVAVPDVSGQSVADATNALAGAGFNVVVGDPILSGVSAGMVANTEPGAGASVTVGNTITIRPSDGKGKQVPDVSGMNPDQAKSALQGVGFNKVDQKCVADPNAPGGDGKVTAQSPDANSMVNPGSASASITITKQSC